MCAGGYPLLMLSCMEDMQGAVCIDGSLVRSFQPWVAPELVLKQAILASGTLEGCAGVKHTVWQGGIDKTWQALGLALCLRSFQC